MDSTARSLALGTSDISELAHLPPGWLLQRPTTISTCGRRCSRAEILGALPLVRVKLPRSLGIRERGGARSRTSALAPRSFLVRGPDLVAVTTAYHIDHSLAHAARRRKGAGLTLLFHYMKMVDTQYTLGGTPVSVKTLEAAGYERRAEFPCMWQVLRPGYRLRNRGSANRVQAVAQAAKDLGRYLSWSARRPRRALALERVAEFGTEVDLIVASWPDPLILTTRSSALLNYYLRCSGGSISGWLVRAAGRPVGFAVLNVLDTGAGRLGNIVECFLEAPDPDLWHAAIFALTRQLDIQGADLAQCVASTAWAEQACSRAAYRPTRQGVVLLLRDRDRALPRDRPFHLTKLEGDHAYLF